MRITTFVTRSVVAATGIGVGCTVAAVLVAARFVFCCIHRRRAAKKGHTNTVAHRVGSDNGDLAAGNQEYRKRESTEASARHELESSKTGVTPKRDRWTRLEGIRTVEINTSDLQVRNCFVQLPHTLEIRIILSSYDLLVFLYIICPPSHVYGLHAHSPCAS